MPGWHSFASWSFAVSCGLCFCSFVLFSTSLYFLRVVLCRVLILVYREFFSFVITALYLGLFSHYAHIVFSLFVFPPQLFARPFGPVYVLGAFLLPPPISLAHCPGYIVLGVAMPLCSAWQFTLLSVCYTLFCFIGKSLLGKGRLFRYVVEPGR